MRRRRLEHLLEVGELPTVEIPPRCPGDSLYPGAESPLLDV